MSAAGMTPPANIAGHYVKPNGRAAHDEPRLPGWPGKARSLRGGEAGDRADQRDAGEDPGRIAGCRPASAQANVNGGMGPVGACHRSLYPRGED